MRSNKSDYEFQRGYICALSCIVKGHGEGIETEEALASNIKKLNKRYPKGVYNDDQARNRADK